MWWLFKKKKPVEEEYVSIWRDDFSDCVTSDYLPSYSFCRTESKTPCRYAARYSETVLCSNPAHKSFIPEGSKPFNPHEDRFSD